MATFASQVDERPRSPTEQAPLADRFFSREQCIDVLTRAAQLARGGGETRVAVMSDWRGNIRWGRNEVLEADDIRNTEVHLTREIRGAASTVVVNVTDNVDLDAAVRRAERFLTLSDESTVNVRRPMSTGYPTPHIWSDATYNFDTERRVALLKTLLTPVVDAGMMSAGYIEVGGHGTAHVESGDRCLYMPHTTAQCTVTIRDPEGTGSGWAGIDHHDWSTIDPVAIVATALRKCLTSRHPVAVEPGRYTAILEPQAVCDLTSPLFGPMLDRGTAEQGSGPFAGRQRGLSKIGAMVAGQAVTSTADPMDPALGYVPFDPQSGELYRPAVWIDHGTLRNLSYDTTYAVQMLKRNTGLPSNGAYHLQGGSTSLDEMIASTERGILVTRFSNLQMVDPNVPLFSGFTRDGLWLIEKGKVSKPIKNFRFVESPLFVLSNIVQMGVPTRVFHPAAPVVVPPLKVNDFNFVSLVDAV